MQKIIATFLLLVLLVPVGLKVAVVADYAVRYNYYATVLCENKDKPMMNCHGTCQLNKNLEQVSNYQDEKPVIPAFAKAELSAFIMNDFKYYFPTVSSTTTANKFPVLTEKYTSVKLDILTPPPSI